MVKGRGHAARFVPFLLGLLGPVLVLEAMDAAFVERLPFKSPEELVVVRGAAQTRDVDFSDWFGSSPTLSGITALTYGRATWTGHGAAKRVNVLVADHATLAVLGLAPSQGRWFFRRDLQTTSTALISEALWRAEFDANNPPRGSLNLNGRVHEVIGVAPSEISRLGPFDVVVPRMESRSYGLGLGKGEGFFDSVVLARRQPTASPALVQRDIERLQRLRETAKQKPSTVTVVGLETWPGAEAAPTLRVLAIAAAVLFLLAAVTIGLLAAMEAVERLPEFATRSALGATRSQIRLEAARPWIRCLLPASLAACVFLIPLSGLTRLAFPSLGQGGLIRPTVLASTLLLALLLALIAFLSAQIPLAIAGGLSPTSGSTKDPRMIMPRVLVSFQASLGVALICAAAVAGKSLHDQIHRDVGLSTKGRSVFRVDLGEGQTSSERTLSWVRLAGEAAALHGAMAVSPPWSAPRSSWVGNPKNEAGGFAAVTAVGAGFFSTLGIPIVAGADPFVTPGVSDVVASEGLMRQLGLSVGSLITVDNELRRVSGVVRGVTRLDQAGSRIPVQIYVAASYGAPSASATVIVRGSSREAAATRARIEAALPSAFVSPVSSLDAEFARGIARQRLGAAVLASYAAVAVILAGLGLHALMRRRVAQSRTEIGIRLALGASFSQVERALLSPLGLPVLLGGISGVWMGFEAAKVMVTWIPWAKAPELEIYVVCVFAAIGIGAAALWPALRVAARVRPIELLRSL